METIDEISVFFPAYNEEKNIAKTVRDAEKVLSKNFRDWEIIIVNDGSSDKTGQIAHQLAKDKKIRVVNHPFNKGYGAAIKSGMYSSKYEWIAFTDGDGQFEIRNLFDLINKQKDENADLVIGYYKKRQVSKIKIFTSKLWELMVFLLFGLKVKDIDCGFKLFRKAVVEKIGKLESERGAFISSEFLIKAKKAGFKIAEIGVTHYPRTEGKGTGRDIKVVLGSFLDLFKLYRQIKFS